LKVKLVEVKVIEKFLFFILVYIKGNTAIYHILQLSTFARGGALLVLERFGAEYCTIAAGALGAGSGAGAGSAGGAGGAGGGGGGGAGALSYGVRLARERPRRTAPAPGAGGGGGPELTTCISSGSFGGVAIEKWMWLCCWWWVAA
jgi:hypothetical protein